MYKKTTIKILLIGDSGVGKTALLYRFVEEVFNPTFITTIGIDFKVKTIDLKDGKSVKLQIWDTAGQERFKQTLTPAYYRNADGVLMVFDVTERKSLENISTWLKNIRENATPSIEKILVANKCDLIDRLAIDRQSIDQIVREDLGDDDDELEVFETSAKSGMNVREVFERVATKVFAKMPSAYYEEETAKKNDTQIVKLESGKKRKKFRAAVRNFPNGCS